MARLRRVVLPGHPHLLIQRARRGTPAFGDAADHVLYLQHLRAAAADIGVEIHAYGLWADEVRLLVTPHHDDALAALMQSVGRRYVRAFNLRYGHSGSPWEGRFRSTVVEAGDFFLNCLRFVEAPGDGAAAGPAGSSPAATTSVGHHLGERIDALISHHPTIWALGNTPFEREAAYRRLVADAMGAERLASILRASANGWALGSPAFVLEVGQLSGRRCAPAPRGRPRKISGTAAAD